jgi:superfamily II DNA or RNA helicase
MAKLEELRQQAKALNLSNISTLSKAELQALLKQIADSGKIPKKHQKSTLAALKEKAKDLGIHKVVGLNKEELSQLIKEVENTGIVPPKHRKKQKVGAPCTSKHECYSGRCKNGECKKMSREQRRERLANKPLEEYNPDLPASDQKVSRCHKFENVKLRPHQKHVAKFLTRSRQKGLLVVHSVGSGKTLTAISAAKCLLAKYPDKRVIILAPSSVANQIKKEVYTVGMSQQLIDKMNIYSHKQWVERKSFDLVDTKDSLLIVDEAHIFRTESKKKKGALSKALADACRQAFKVILMTATPLVNSSKDLRNYMAMVKGTTLESEYKIFKDDIDPLSRKNLQKYMNCKVSFFKNHDRTYYPEVNHYRVRLTMSKKYQEVYDQVENSVLEKEQLQDFFGEKNLEVFYNGIRRASNTNLLASPKVEWIMDKVKDEVKDNRKVVIYSSWKDFGTNMLANQLSIAKIPYVTVTGDLSKTNRAKAVEKYNSGAALVMLISAAGAEGLDLKCTRSLIIMEPYWNMARIEQVIGRAVRYKSHEALDPEDRTVDVFNVILTKNTRPIAEPDDDDDDDNDEDGKRYKRKFVPGHMPSADELLEEMAESKIAKLKPAYKAIIRASIEKNDCK